MQNEALAAQAATAASETASQAPDTLSIFESLKQGDFQPLTQAAMEYIPQAIIVVLAIMVAYFVANFFSRIAAAPVRRRVDETLGRFVGKLVFYGIMIGVVLGVAGYVGINVSSFAAIIGAAAFAIGLAFQGTLANFSAGILLLVFRPFKVGDVISAAGITAKVNEIDLFTTTFDTPDNRRIIVPNSAISGGTIENITFHKERRVDVAVGTAYSASLDDTRAALTQAAESLRDKMIVGEGRGYQIVLGELGESAIGWTVRFWTRAQDYFSVKEELTRTIKNTLDAAGISIPFPQLDVNFFTTDGEHATATGTSKDKIKPRMRFSEHCN